MKKVAIIGANSTIKYAPLDDLEWEIWGCNSLWNMCRNKEGKFKATRWFELHPMEVQTPEELKAIAQCPVPIYTLTDESSWAKNSVVYPLENILNIGPRYFTCTFAYQIALAILQDFETIGLYGVELWQGTPRERLTEKACVEFWLGMAFGHGINVILPQTCMAHQSLLYGYDYQKEAEYANACVDALCYHRAKELGYDKLESEEVQSVSIREGHA